MRFSWSISCFCFYFSFDLFDAMNGLITSCCFGGRWTPFFICQERSSFHSYQKPSVLLFLLLLLAFVFALVCIQILLYLFIKVYFCLWTMLVFLKRVGLKKFE
jgi:hypothetical protein